jgi:hypothetical protein
MAASLLESFLRLDLASLINVCKQIGKFRTQCAFIE